jgi:purine-nucleoside phosphorylase
MSDPYSSKYHDQIEQIARNRGISLKKGVLWASTGPSYETKAEVEMIRKYGGDAGSMSTAPEVIAAIQAGLKVIGISCITNYATGSSSKKLSHSEVTETAQKVKKQFVDLISGILTEIVPNI